MAELIVGNAGIDGGKADPGHGEIGRGLTIGHR
jgi:hypothetical protein